MINKQTTK